MHHVIICQIQSEGLLLREFFGIGGYQRPAEGFMSWQHLTFVTSLMVAMVALAWWLGKRNRDREPAVKNKVLTVAAWLIFGLYIFEIVFPCFREHDPWKWLYNLPLFLCSMQMFALPMAAFCKGKLREAALDFVFIFGILGALLGTYGAGQNYNAYPVLSFNNVQSGLTHSISGFASLYIAFSGLTSMKRENIGWCFGVLIVLCAVAYGVNHLVDYNYMFLMRGDGTPYDILYNLVGGSPVWYPLGVVGLFLLYIVVFYLVYYKITHRKAKVSV